MPIVTFFNAAGRKMTTCEVASGTLLFDAAVQAGLPVASSCTKNIVCGKCVMEITEGGENFPHPVDLEKKLLDRDKRRPNERLSCAVSLTSNCSAKTKYW